MRRAAAVIFDRDGTLIRDTPYNVDPRRVRPMRYAREALARLRAAGVATAVASNQAAVAAGRLHAEDVDVINHRMEELIGPVGPILVCPHGESDGCACRKPAPGLLLEAAAALGIAPAECVMVGDIGSDMLAARAAGTRAILVPTNVTLAAEIAGAPWVASHLGEAVDLILRGAA